MSADPSKGASVGVGVAPRQKGKWICKCGHVNQRTASPTCKGCGERTKPKKRRPKHSEVLRGDSYPIFVEAAQLIHGVTDESCCACGKPRPQERRWDRDHGHRKGQADYGRPRGLLCAGNQGCNVLLLPWVTAPVARAIAVTKLAALESDASRWDNLAAYLERVEAHYQEQTQ